VPGPAAGGKLAGRHFTKNFKLTVTVMGLIGSDDMVQRFHEFDNFTS
jgi:hypothetical protein